MSKTSKSKKSSKAQATKKSPSQSSSFKLWFALPTVLAAVVASGAWYYQPEQFQSHLTTTLNRLGINENTLNHFGIKIPSFVSSDVSDEELYDYQGILHDRTIFKVVKMRGKGMGMIAVRDIKQGELVISEKPLLLAPADEIPRSFISDLFQNWNQSQTNALLSLSWSKLKTNDTINMNPSTQTEEERYFMTEGIIQNNAVALRKGGEPYLSVFPRMARINHACAGSFNMMFSWREAEEELRVYAIKDVKRGEELTITYIESRRPKEERIKHLEDAYGFTCTCHECSLPVEESKVRDEKMEQFTILYTKFTRWLKGNITGPEAIQVMHEIWNLSMEMDYPSERGRFAEEAAYIATIHGDKEAARQWLELGLKWSSVELGEDSERAQRARYTLDHLDEHPHLGSREKVDVGGPLKEWF
ncbi:set domain-containing protein 5 [Moniliophthora roreri MCA 2997]|uniref:Set domain-containing protein 5 n=2 Tax=Moniliophthora roreri TaxID=221103 RepID=V2X6C7_MONRO|nr:set domain-containing protein 5 [Moniliophthora roreri MCA 2997]KAI3596783.1 set domain-containing protein 5 [Moniliophthora roreri]